MSKRNRQRKIYKPGNQLVTVRGSNAEAAIRAELLSKPTNLFEDNPAVQMLQRRLASKDCSDAEAIRIGLALQAMIDPERALVNNQNLAGVQEQIRKLEARAEERDRAMEAYDKDRDAFVADVLERAPKPTGAKKDELIAKGVRQYQEAMNGVGARQAEQKLKFQEHLKNDPKELVHVPAQFEMQRRGDQTGMYEVPFVMKILDHTFAFRAGDHMMPHIVAEHYRQIVRQKQEVAERKALMAKNENASKLQQDLIHIDRTYGAPNERVLLPFPPGVGEE